MPGANTTIDARAALRAVISDRYERDITSDMWSSMKPSDAPPKGLGSGDGDDWQITLDDASDKMVNQRYVMADISLDEAKAERTAVLDDSVSLLVSKASSASFIGAKFRSHPRNFGLLLAAGALTGLLVAIGAVVGANRKGRR